MNTPQNRTPFKVLRPHQFNLSTHRVTQVSPRTKKLMPTIIRLARLMKVADPSRSPKLLLNSQEELEKQIYAFRDLVHQQHFPLFGYEEEEEEVWIEQEEYGQTWPLYHPLLDEIPIHSLGFSHHDIEPESYGDLVALLYWLGITDPSRQEFDGNFSLNDQWDLDERAKFSLARVLPILDYITLKPPLIFLPGLIRTVLHETDTFFLDACPLCGGFSGPDFSWTVENFIWFRNDWQKAKPIYEGNKELIKWSESLPQLTEISMILKRAFSIHLFYKDQRLPEWCQ